MVDQLTQDCIAARKAGMTYGKWKAMHYVPPVEVEIPKQEVKPEPKVKKEAPKRVCRYCGKEFVVGHRQMWHCSEDCSYESQKARQKAKYWMKKERMMADGKI